MFTEFRHTFLGPLLGACLFKLFVVFGVVCGPLLPKNVLGLILEAMKMCCKKGFATMLRVLRKGVGGSTKTSGPDLSWVLVPLGVWSLERGQGGSGWDLVTSCARSVRWIQNFRVPCLGSAMATARVSGITLQVSIDNPLLAALRHCALNITTYQKQMQFRKTSPPATTHRRKENERTQTTTTINHQNS